MAHSWRLLSIPVGKSRQNVERTGQTVSSVRKWTVMNAHALLVFIFGSAQDPIPWHGISPS